MYNLVSHKLNTTIKSHKSLDPELGLILFLPDLDPYAITYICLHVVQVHLVSFHSYARFHIPWLKHPR